MRKRIRQLGWMLVAGLGLPLVALLLLVTALNTEPGRRALERVVAQLTADELTISGLSGRFPDALHADRVEVRDESGAWLVIQDLDLSWSPLHLLHREARIIRLEAAQISVERLPVYPPDADETDWTLPVEVTMQTLQAVRLLLSPPILGTSATLNVSGHGRFSSLEHADLQLTVSRQDQQGMYRGDVLLQPSGLDIQLSIEEGPQGLLAAWSGLSELGRLSLAGNLKGPPSAARLMLRLGAGPLDAKIQGQVDLEQQTLDLTLSASAPSMGLRPGLSWQSAAVAAEIRGAYAQPKATGTLEVQGLQAEEGSIRRITADITGDATGALRLEGSLDGLRIRGPLPDLFAASPFSFEAAARLEQPHRPLTFSLRHPLLRARGQFATAGAVRGDVLLHAPHLGAFGALGGLDVQGNGELSLQVAESDHDTRMACKGRLNLTGGEPYLVRLFGEDTKIDASLILQGPQLTVSQLVVAGKMLRLSVGGRYTPKKVDVDWKLAVSDLAALAPQISGHLTAEGQVSGPREDLNLRAAFSGTGTSRPIQGGPFKGEIQLRGLLGDSPAGTVTVRAMVAGSAADVVLGASIAPTHDLRMVLERAEWKSTRVHGAFVLARGSARPVGTLDWRTDRLEDVEPWLGISMAGSARATLTTTQRNQEILASLVLEGTGVRIGGVRVNALRSSLSLSERGNGSILNGRVSVADYAVGALGGNAHLEFAGPTGAIKLTQSGTLRQADGTPAEWSASGILNTEAAQLDISTFKAAWRGETLHLVRPARLNLAEGVRVDSLWLRLRQANLRISGRLSPTLDLSGQAHDVPVNLAVLLMPNLPLEGSLNAETRLTGPYERLRGAVSVRVTGLQLRRVSGRAVPPAELSFHGDLDGDAVQLTAGLRAGTSAVLNAQGRAPMSSAGSLDLRAEGSLDMKALDPLLTPEGRRLRGTTTLKAHFSGTLADPRAEGNLQVSKGEFQDYAVGARISDIVASAQFDGDTLRLIRFDGRVGPGRVTAMGTLGSPTEGWPLEIKISARNARPLSGERLNVTLDSDLAVRGTPKTRLNVAGSVNIRRAEIRIPERMPARIAVLDVRKPGAVPPPPPPSGLEVGLSLTIDAAREIFVRGRGLDAELGGRVHLQGTADNPEPTGSFAMRRGEFKLAGKTLTFSKGQVGFDGGTLTDPALDFIASTASPNVTATLAVSGTASKPKILLSSVPELPQDEILAHLLFGRNAASLGPLEMAEIASALAALTGVSGRIANPLEAVRQGLGLDRLSMGSSKAGPTLEAGRYIAPGVYLGAKQGFTGATPSAAVQIDVTEGLKVEGTVGTGSPSSSQSGTSSAGIIYQFEY